MMTVIELFDKFTNFFDKVAYFDEINNIQDTIYIKKNGEIHGEIYYDFLNNYGVREVCEWEYSYERNCLYIQLK